MGSPNRRGGGRWPLGSRLKGIEDRATLEWVLQQEWDPIGVADGTLPHDEYTHHAAALMGMLVRGADAALLQDALLRFERDAMALQGNIARAARVAGWLAMMTQWEQS